MVRPCTLNREIGIVGDVYIAKKHPVIGPWKTYGAFWPIAGIKVSSDGIRLRLWWRKWFFQKEDIVGLRIKRWWFSKVIQVMLSGDQSDELIIVKPWRVARSIRLFHSLGYNIIG